MLGRSGKNPYTLSCSFAVSSYRSWWSESCVPGSVPVTLGAELVHRPALQTEGRLPPGDRVDSDAVVTLLSSGVHRGRGGEEPRVSLLCWSLGATFGFLCTFVE